MNDDDLTLTTITLTDHERRVHARALQVLATMMDALDNAAEAFEAAELASRIAPEMDE